jgi:four helix bundle protein
MTGSFVAHELGIELVRRLGAVLPTIMRRDKDLGRQLRRSASSVVLNLAEGANSDPGNRQARYSTAAGSAKETKSALIIAESWGYIEDPELLALADRVTAVTYRLAYGHGPPPRPNGPGPTVPEPEPAPVLVPDPATD